MLCTLHFLVFWSGLVCYGASAIYMYWLRCISSLPWLHVLSYIAVCRIWNELDVELLNSGHISILCALFTWLLCFFSLNKRKQKHGIHLTLLDSGGEQYLQPTPINNSLLSLLPPSLLENILLSYFEKQWTHWRVNVFFMKNWELALMSVYNEPLYLSI